MEMKNKFSTFFKPVLYWIDKTCVQAKKVCKYVWYPNKQIKYPQIARQPTTYNLYTQVPYSVHASP